MMTPAMARTSPNAESGRAGGSKHVAEFSPRGIGEALLALRRWAWLVGVASASREQGGRQIAVRLVVKRGR